MREKGYILSNMDIKTYLELLKELKKYLNKYYFIKNGVFRNLIIMVVNILLYRCILKKVHTNVYLVIPF